MMELPELFGRAVSDGTPGFLEARVVFAVPAALHPAASRLPGERAGGRLPGLLDAVAGQRLSAWRGHGGRRAATL